MRKCKEGFVKTYLEYTKNQESPTIFHTWTALSTIAAVLRRRVWMSSGANEPGYYNIYPNLYMVLISPSGIGKKSTAIDQGLELIDAVGIKGMQILRGKITPKKLVTRLDSSILSDPEGRAELLIFSREFRVFTRGIMSDSSLIEDLTHLYDGKPHGWETEEKGVYEIKKPCINIMAASTPEWLAGGHSGDLMTGGFGSRVTPIAITKGERSESWPRKTRRELELQELLTEDLRRISGMSGQVWITPEGEKFFDEWYEVRDERRNPDKRLDGYYAKRHDQVRKVAMLLSVSQSDDLAVDERHFLSALVLFNQLEQTLPYAFTGVAWGEEARFVDKVLEEIKEAGEITHSKLLQKFHFAMTTETLKKIIQTLIDEEKVKWERVKGTTKTRLVYRYVGGEEEKGGDS